MMTVKPVSNRLLVVDDDPLLRSISERTLRHAGFEVTVAGSGEEAISAFESEQFSLVLLDVMMPGIDGYETCTRLRAMPKGVSVPILMLTGLNDSESIDQAYQAGATDFIAKPINWTLLAQRVRYALRAAAATESAVRSRQQLERAQHIAMMGSWEIAIDSERMNCSAALATIFRAPGRSAARISPAAFLQLVHPDDRPAVQAARQAAAEIGTPYQMNFRIHRFDGVERAVFEQAQAVLDAAGRRVAIEGITQDITERVEAERRISQLSQFDAMTGLPNRQFFTELAAPALERAAGLSRSCALLHVDIDRFKSVNDAFGHAGGDRVLKLLAERLQASVRHTDMALTSRVTDTCVARVGGNAFTVLLVDVDCDRQAAQVAERLMAALAKPVAVEGRELTVSASVGIAMYPRDAIEPKALARCGEQAVYEAKSAGRAQMRFFDEAMNASASLLLSRESELRRAIAQGQLRLYYQPKVDAGCGQIVGAEALVRWQHPERGLLSPAEFIPLAEESGLILPLTDWVLETTCSDLRKRADRGLCDVPVSVNLASPSFVRDGLNEQLSELLVRHRLDPAALTLEVTESMLMKNADLAVLRLQQLRDQGFRLSLDDFGTGFSSLSYLKLFPVDELKIDRAFVAEACLGGRESAIARSVIALGREFGLRVVAEGVETTEQAAFLLDHGCFHQQGYLFARPMPGSEFDVLLANGAMTAMTMGSIVTEEGVVFAIEGA
ncbi:MAG: EAL domain-containing protein [Burkholderiales bacterium]